MQMELLSSAVHMRTGRADYLCDSCVDTIVPVAFLIFEPIQSINSIFFVNPASYVKGYLLCLINAQFICKMVLLKQKASFSPQALI